MQGRLKYKIVSYSSEDNQHPVSNLLVKGSNGWQSGRFCSYPQEITLQFYSPVHIKQLQFMSNCRKISSRIDILYYSERDSVQSRFNKYGFVQLSTNQQTNYEGRQVKLIMVDIHCSYVRFLMHKPHQNRQNFFSQVGLHEINVIGEGLDLLTEPYTSRVASQNAEYIDEKSIEDEFIYSKLIILQQFKDQAVKEENYDQAKRLKEIINSVKSLGYQIKGLADKKKQAVDSEDYDKAQKIKGEIERIRSSANHIISNINNPHYRANTAQRDEEQGQLSESGVELEKSRVSVRIPIQTDNEFVEEFKDPRKYGDAPVMRISHDDRVLPTHMGKQKTQVRQDDPPPETQDKLPPEPQPLTTQVQKEGAHLLSIFDQMTVRQFYSKHWQYRLEAMKTFINELKSPNMTKGKSDSLLFKAYMNIVSSTISEKVVQICHHSLLLLQELLLVNTKMHNEARIHEYQGDADVILHEIIKRMNDNNIKVKGLADELFRKMCENGIYGIINCSNALMKVGNNKLSPKQYKSKIDTLTYLISVHEMANNPMILAAVDFAVTYVNFHSPEVRNSVIDLLIQASLNGAQDKVKQSIDKLQSNIKEMIHKKMKNAKQAKETMNPTNNKKGKAIKK